MLRFARNDVLMQQYQDYKHMGFHVSLRLVVKISLYYQCSISSDELLCGTDVEASLLISA